MAPVSLVIPAYNEEKRLPGFLDTVIEYAQQHPQHIAEVLIVDDGSKDATHSIATAYADKLPGGKVLQHEKNRGKGAAVQTGVLAATAEYIVFIDADGATPVHELPKMVEALASAQIAVGNRWMKDSQAHRSTWLRHLAGWVYKTYMAMFGLGGIDTMCGFKGYHRAVAQDLFKNLVDQRWLFDTEIAYKAVRKKYSIKNFPIEWESKEGSKLSSFDLFKSALGIWPLIQKIKKDKILHER